jgi:hypothetical protein
VSYASITPGGPGVNALRERWDARFHLKGFEEAEIVSDFDQPEGVDSVGEQIHIRIIPAVTAQTGGDSSELDPTALNYASDTILEVTDTPDYRYNVVALPNNLVARLGAPDTAKLESGYRELMLGSLVAAVDYNGGGLFPGISAVRGPANADQALILDMQTALATGAKNHVKIGKTPMHLRFHPSQIKYVHNIAAYANAEQRGDSENPNVGGVILKAQGMTLQETGNINFSGGSYWNALYAKTYAVLAYNRTPHMLDKQPYGLSNLLLGEVDFLTVEVFDDDAVAWKSA